MVDEYEKQIGTLERDRRARYHENVESLQTLLTELSAIEAVRNFILRIIYFNLILYLDIFDDQFKNSDWKFLQKIYKNYKKNQNKTQQKIILCRWMKTCQTNWKQKKVRQLLFRNNYNSLKQR